MDDLLSSLLQEDEHETEIFSVSERFPLNKRSFAVETKEGSDRVRLRKVLSQVEECGLSAQGAEPSQHRPDAQVQLRAEFARSGEIKNSYLQVKLEEGLDDEQIEAVQAALQSQGFKALTTAAGRIVVLGPKHQERLLEWYELGAGRASETVSLAQAQKWVAANTAFSDVQLLDSWHESGFNLDVCCEWVSIDRLCPSLTRVDKARPWIEAGVSADEACGWAKISMRLSSYPDAKEWRDNLSLEDASWWIKATSSGWDMCYDKVADFAAQGVTARHIKKLEELGFDERSTKGMMELLSCGLTVERIMEWALLGPTACCMGRVPSTFEARGLNPQNAKEWSALTVGRVPRAELVADWSAAGYKAQQAKEWIERNQDFWDFALVSQWLQAGKSLQEAEPWILISESAAKRRDRGCREMLSYEWVNKWTSLGAPFDQPSSVERMVIAGILPEQAAAVTAEICSKINNNEA